MAKNTGVDTIKDNQAECELLERKKIFRGNLGAISQAETDTGHRDIAVSIAERYLDGQKYDLNRITAEIKATLTVIGTGYLEVGRRLLAVKEAEGHGEFCSWLETNFPLSRRMASRYMKFALFIQSRPDLHVLAKGGISKALILLDMPEEYLQEIEEEETIDGKPLDEIQAMTKKELEAEIKKLKANNDKIIAEETKGLSAENAALIAENKRLKKFQPVEESTPEWCIEQALEVQKAALRIGTAINLLLSDERLLGDIPTMAKIESYFLQAEKELSKIRREWYAATDPE